MPLPEWADDLAVEGSLLIPAQCEISGSAPGWQRVDWIAAAFWYITGCAERVFEATHGPIHSYSARLVGWDSRLWEHAWVNRIALLLRRMAARNAGVHEDQLFGPRPVAELVLTHDVDAIRMSWSLRVKQCAFHGLNALRLLSQRQPRRSFDKLCAAARFATHSGELWYFAELAALVKRHGVQSKFFFYGRAPRWRPLHLRLIDPAYDVLDARLAETLKELHREGFEIGLHQSFDSWQDAQCMREEKARVEAALGSRVEACRQHWLRFSWAHTWEAQEAAGLRLDTTLGFNDRPGFRNGAALCFRPWAARRGSELALECIPTVLMDSQLYDYAQLCDTEREREIKRWVDELRAVGGVASVIWHVHTLGPEYGWRGGLEMLLDIMSAGKQ